MERVQLGELQMILLNNLDWLIGVILLMVCYIVIGLIVISKPKKERVKRCDECNNFIVDGSRCLKTKMFVVDCGGPGYYKCGVNDDS